jgi:hypothetical protein
MERFLQRFGDKIKGVITGFDRIVFKGCIRPLMFAEGAMSFLRFKGVLNKDYKDWMMKQSATIVESAERYTRLVSGRGIDPIRSSKERKEELAHARQRERGVNEGLIGAWSSVEACSTYRACYDAKAGFPQLRHDFSRCKHLYFYYDHPQYGFLSVRLQTWFPYGIQIALNGREWLRRSLDRQGVEYVVHGNKFLHIDDYVTAQKQLNLQTDARWTALLNGFLPDVFPSMSQTLGPGFGYYWTLWQSEWATDYIFDRPATLQPMMDSLLRHALATGTCDRILRYMGRPVDTQGQPHPMAEPEVMTRAAVWHDGMRIRHWVDENSIKLYNEHNVLRAEMTMNNPAMFRVWRRKEGQSKSDKKTRRSLRKGIADIPLRAQVANDVNDGFMKHMATLRNDTPLNQLFDSLTHPFTLQGRRVRALDIVGKDRELLLALADPLHAVCGITNRLLQKTLHASPWAKGHTSKALSARISRHLRLLRDHGLLRKVPNQRKYMLTDTGRSLATALPALLAVSIQQLTEKAA